MNAEKSEIQKPYANATKSVKIILFILRNTLVNIRNHYYRLDFVTLQMKCLIKSTVFLQLQSSLMHTIKYYVFNVERHESCNISYIVLLIIDKIDMLFFNVSTFV